MLWVVVWYTLDTGVTVCSGELSRMEALRILHSGMTGGNTSSPHLVPVDEIAKIENAAVDCALEGKDQNSGH